MRERRQGAEEGELTDDHNIYNTSTILKTGVVSFCPLAQTDRSGDSGGLCLDYSMLCVSAGLIKTTAQAQQG